MQNKCKEIHLEMRMVHDGGNRNGSQKLNLTFSSLKETARARVFTLLKTVFFQQRDFFNTLPLMLFRAGLQKVVIFFRREEEEFVTFLIKFRKVCTTRIF